MVSATQPYHPAPPQGGLFTGTDTIAKERTQLLRRLAFTMLTTPPDNAQLLLQILERLVEATKLGAPIATRHAILCFRVLILKASPQNLSLFWPSILHEVCALVRCQRASTGTGPVRHAAGVRQGN